MYQRLLNVFLKMAARARIAIGLALLITFIAVIGKEISWIAVPLLLFAVFFIIWGKEQRATEVFIGKLPMGRGLLKVLDQVDAVLVVQDRSYNQHIRTIILGYDTELRSALRTLYRTRNTNLVEQYRSRFVADGFIEYPKDGPGWIKSELRDIVGRTLDELGV